MQVLDAILDTLAAQYEIKSATEVLPLAAVGESKEWWWKQARESRRARKGYKYKV